MQALLLRCFPYFYYYHLRTKVKCSRLFLSTFRFTRNGATGMREKNCIKNKKKIDVKRMNRNEHSKQKKRTASKIISNQMEHINGRNVNFRSVVEFFLFPFLFEVFLYIFFYSILLLSLFWVPNLNSCRQVYNHTMQRK